MLLRERYPLGEWAWGSLSGKIPYTILWRYLWPEERITGLLRVEHRHCLYRYLMDNPPAELRAFFCRSSAARFDNMEVSDLFHPWRVFHLVHRRVSELHLPRIHPPNEQRYRCRQGSVCGQGSEFMNPVRCVNSCI